MIGMRHISALRPQCSRQPRSVTASATRREAAVLLGSTLAGGLWPRAATAAGALPATACSTLDPALAAVFMEAVYATVQEQQVVPVEQLQRERFKLQAQEYPYFLAANKERLPALPDLSDNSGGLRNRLYFNFVSYILWKAVARHLPTPEQRTRFCTGVGQQLLQQLAPGEAAALREAAARQRGGGGGSSQQAPAAVLLPSVQQVLARLQAGGFVCGWQMVWDDQPGSWPGDWASSEPQLVGADGLLLQQQPLERGTVFQLRGCLLLLLVLPLLLPLLLPLVVVTEVKLQQPADIEASVALRSEEDGFWSRHVSSLLAALMAVGGYGGAVADEYFYQDDWQGPASVGDRLLLLLGDPLQQVEVPWTPTTLVQNWTLA